MKYKLLAFLIIPSVLCFSLLAPPPKASASPMVGTCASAPSDFDWVSHVKNAISNFSQSDSSYIVWQDPSTVSSGFPGYNIYVSSNNANPLVLTGDTYTGYGGGPGAIKYQVGTSIDSGTITDVNYTPNPWYGGSKKQEAINPPSSLSTLSYPSGLTSYPFSPTQVSCVVAAHNVIYAPNWTFDQFNKSLGNSAGVAASSGGSTVCSPLDIACKLANLFSSVTDYIGNIMTVFWKSVVSMFVPDSIDIATIWSNFYNQLQTTMGFMFYPITFITNLYSAMTDTSNNWCTSSSCTVNAGSFFGSNYSINLLALQNAIPGAWSLLDNLAKGALVFGLVFMIRRKMLAWIGNQKESDG